MTHEDTTLDLSTGLPALLPSSERSNNYALLEPIGKELDKSSLHISDIDYATTVQDQMAPDRTIAGDEDYVIGPDEVEYYNTLTINGTLTVRGGLGAATVEVNGTLDNDGGTIKVDEDFIINRLAELGRMVNLPPDEGETASHYRARLIVEFSLLSTEGTIRDVLTTAAEIFSVSEEKIGYQEPAGGENGTVQLKFPSQALDELELSGAEATNILDRVLAAGYRIEGVTVGTFTYITPEDYNDGNHDASKGYDGLDANGDPKDNGGTYAGTI